MANPHLPGAADLATAKGAAAAAPADGDKPKAAYRYGSQLRLCAPAHSGLPMNATAIVACSRHTSEGWRYDVTLTGGGPSGSGVRFVQNVAEGWLRDENRIATAKECAMRPWGQWVRSAPRLLEPVASWRWRLCAAADVLRVLAGSAQGRQQMLQSLGNLLHAALVDLDRSGREPKGGEWGGESIQRLLPVTWHLACVELATLSRMLRGE